MTSSRVIIYLDNVIFHRLQCRLSDWNYADGDYDTWFSANFQYIIATKMLCLRGSAPDTVVGLTAPPRPSCETLGHTLAEGPTELRAPGPRYPTVRHWSLVCELFGALVLAVNAAPYFRWGNVRQHVKVWSSGWTDASCY